MPDIFKAPWLYVTEEDTVEIPDFIPGEGEAQAEEAAAGGDEAEADDLQPEDGPPEEEAFILGISPDRRLDARRRIDRREEDQESLESLVRRYREKVRLTKESFFEDIGPKLIEDLRAQMLEIREEAYRDELLSQREELHRAIDSLDRGLKVLDASHAAYIEELTEELKFMALDIAERILRKEVEGHKRVLEALALELVAEVKEAPWINVEVSEEVEGLADHLRTQLDKAEQGKTIYVYAKDVPPDSLRIVTEEGVIDATISTQIKQLREAFMRAEREGDNIT